IWTWDPTSLCPTDVDNNRIVEVTDILLFMDLLRAQNVFADLNSDGRWDLLDFNIFMNRWQPGFCDPDDPINPFGRPTGVIPG
ncbi:MAG: GC-type dockerin domain-anchored protein, partial [Phycisphaerales bacterium JB059]